MRQHLSTPFRFFYQPLYNMPEKGAVLDWLKITAAFLMVIDHVNTIFLGADFYVWLIGRIVFPVFVLISAIHIGRGIDTKKYLLKLLPFALISQVPYFFAQWGAVYEYDLSHVTLNIIFTIGFGVLLAKYLFEKQANPILVFLAAFLYWVSGLPDGLEYGSMGLILPYSFYCVLKQRKYAPILLFLNLCFLNLTPHDFVAFEQEALLSFVYASVVALFLGVYNLGTTAVFVSFFSRYRQSDRFLPRYFLHFFYPAHLGVLAIIYWFF